MSPERIEKSEEEEEGEGERRPKKTALSRPTDDVGLFFDDDGVADKVRRGIIWFWELCEEDVVKVMSCRGAALLRWVV